VAGVGVSVCELHTMPCRAPQSYDDLTVYIILNDHGEFGIASEETDPAKADRETIIRNCLTAQYGHALRIIKRGGRLVVGRPRRLGRPRFSVSVGLAIDCGDRMATQ
jgi:hypothetical protein